MIGRTVGNYRILEKLGEGGMGAVFKGIDVMVDGVVRALQTIHELIGTEGSNLEYPLTMVRPK